MKLQIKDLIDGQKLVAISGGDTLSDAMRKMTQEDFSQLPVVDEFGRLIHTNDGSHTSWMVTYESILKAAHIYRVDLHRIKVSDALTKVQVFRPETQLPEVLDAMGTQYAVVVAPKNCVPIGILTSFDTTAYFRSQTQDLLLVQDIEDSLKDHIRGRFNRLQNQHDLQELEQVITEVTQRTRTFFKQGDTVEKKFESLSLAQYVRMITSESQWQNYVERFDIDSEAFANMMELVVKTRNALAHLEDVDRLQSARLQVCHEWLMRHQNHEDSEFLHIVRIPELPIDEVLIVNQGPLPTKAEDLLAEEKQPSDSGYLLLSTFLLSRPLDEQRVKRTFTQVEHIIDDSLPDFAFRHRSWWGNDVVNSAQAQAWFEAGWRVASVNLQEQVVTFARIHERQRLYIEFFSNLLQELGSSSNMAWKHTSPDGSNWLAVEYIPKEIYIGTFIYTFARGGRFRAELYIDCGNEHDNKEIFDQLYRQRNSIEATANQALGWERLDHRRACRIAMYHKGSILDSPESLTALRIWAIDAMVRLRNALTEPFLKTTPVESMLLKSSIGLGFGSSNG